MKLLSSSTMALWAVCASSTLLPLQQCPPTPIPPPGDASTDAGSVDSGRDASLDAGKDAAKDAGDAGDAGDSGIKDAGTDGCPPSMPLFLPAPTKYGLTPETDDTSSSNEVCPKPAPPGGARCLSRVVTSSKKRAGKLLLGADVPFGYGPAQLHGGYSLPTTSSTPQTVAVVIAYGDPKVKADLDVYNSTYGLPYFPECCGGRTTGCFQRVNQDGNAYSFPGFDAGWSLEESMDVQTVHQICQSCRLIVVEARSPNFSDLSVAVNTAVRLGATQVSNSYGGADSSLKSAYDHPGVAIVASSGDDGYAGGPSSPASFRTVVAAGGTSLYLTTSNTWSREAAWNNAGSGCSTLNVAPSWQLTAAGWTATGCGTKRGIADVAADADPATGAAVYHSTPYNGRTGWFVLGGTSLSAPILAGVFALRADGAGVDYPGKLPYSRTPLLHDVSTGTNGTCTTTICKGAAGYDGPTGVGTPNGPFAF